MRLSRASCSCPVSQAPPSRSGGFSVPAKPKSYVSYTAEPQTVSAGKRSVLELRFHVQDGFHVNSHTPKSDLLIPTRVEFESAEGVEVTPAEYPPGSAYSFSFDPSEKLDVYSGAFTVRVPIVAKSGSHTIEGTLKYQACDQAACYPPKSLPIEIIVSAQ